MRGFTLVELLVTCALLALLTALALPGYQAIMLRGVRPDARLALLRVQVMQERHYSEHLRFARSLTNAPQDDGLGLAARSEAGHFLLRLLPRAGGAGYTVIAQPDPLGRAVADDDCAWYSVDERGLRRAAGRDGQWRSVDTPRCWS